MSTNSSTGVGAPLWPTHLLAVSEVRDWIAAVSPHAAPVTVIGPAEIYQEKGWGVTARFTITPPPVATDAAAHQDIVFAASALPLYAYTPAVYELLIPHVPEQIPELVTWTRRHEQIWMLFRPFTGLKIAVSPSVADLQGIARLMALIQARIAALPRAKLAPLPHFPVHQFPARFDELLRDVQDVHRTVWEADDRAIARRFSLPADPVAALASYRSQVVAWSHELNAGAWPATIDHVDLQGDNVVRLADGRLLLHDWEGAVIGCPFFSLDRLLDDARALDRGQDAHDDALAAATHVMFGHSALANSPTERAVRAAYLATLPWQTRDARERAFDLALALAPLKGAYEAKLHTRALGKARSFSVLAAFWLARALPRWRSLQ